MIALIPTNSICLKTLLLNLPISCFIYVSHIWEVTFYPALTLAIQFFPVHFLVVHHTIRQFYQ